MNAIFSPDSTRLVRILSALAVGVVVVQLLLLQHSEAARLVEAIPVKVLFFFVFGAVAALLWLATGVRWPLTAWAVFVLIAAIDQTQQAPFAAGSIADAATSPAALPVLMR
jgi:hypothetical protein